MANPKVVSDREGSAQRDSVYSDQIQEEKRQTRRSS